MPLIQVKLVEGVFDTAEKEAIIEKPTMQWSASRAKRCGPSRGSRSRKSPADWGIAGKALHTGDIVGMRSPAQ